MATLAHAASAPPFNANFYIVSATVIPVLFLAIAVQGRGYENLMKAFAAMDRRSDRDIPWRYAATTAAGVLLVIATLVLVFAVHGEIVAVYALYQQHAASTTGQPVLIGVILLIIATATGPALTLLGYLFRSARAAQPATRSQAARQHPGDTSSAAEAPPEPGKTDPA